MRQTKQSLDLHLDENLDSVLFLEMNTTNDAVPPDEAKMLWDLVEYCSEKRSERFQAEKEWRKDQYGAAMSTRDMGGAHRTGRLVHKPSA